jgi:hypothetical protein
MIFDCLVFVMLQAKGQEKRQVSGRHPVFVFRLLCTTWLNLNILELPGFLLL